jgi:hypothetical protein
MQKRFEIFTQSANGPQMTLSEYSGAVYACEHVEHDMTGPTCGDFILHTFRDESGCVIAQLHNVRVVDCSRNIMPSENAHSDARTRIKTEVFETRKEDARL